MNIEGAFAGYLYISGVYCSSCKVAVTYVRFFLVKFEFSVKFFEIGYPQISDFMKLRLVGAEVFRADT